MEIIFIGDDQMVIDFLNEPHPSVARRIPMTAGWKWIHKAEHIKPHQFDEDPLGFSEPLVRRALARRSRNA